MLFRFIISSILLISCISEKDSEPEKYIIPDNYTGIIVLICNQSEGNPKKYEEERRVYEIDSLGVLVTQFDCNHGRHKDTRENIKFHYQNGTNIPLRLFKQDEFSSNANDPKSNEIQVYEIINGTVGSTEFKSCIIDTYDNRSKYMSANNNGQMKFVSEMIDLYIQKKN